MTEKNHVVIAENSAEFVSEISQLVQSSKQKFARLLNTQLNLCYKNRNVMPNSVIYKDPYTLDFF